jgi:[acyl-carrier-protein] S-malonyltransferase
MGSVAWLFPGQGSQTVGMGRELAERYRSAMHVFAEGSDAIGVDLKRLAWESPAADLDQTANTQPALLVASIAALRAAQEAGPIAEPRVLLGHSLGEFTALVAAGALPLADAVRLVRKRGELMQAAADTAHPGGSSGGPGGMLAVLGGDIDAIARALAGTSLVIANDNAPGQVVISGPRADFDRATAALKEAGVKRVIPLRTSGAFHSPAMRAVAEDLAETIAKARWDALRLPVIANVDAQMHEHAADFPKLLEKQVWSRVEWVASVRRAEGEGATAFVEFGPGNVLTGLAKRIVASATTANVSDETTLREALPVLR